MWALSLKLEKVKEVWGRDYQINKVYSRNRKGLLEILTSIMNEKGKLNTKKFFLNNDNKYLVLYFYLYW